MTAPAPRPGPDVAGRLAEALADWNNLPPMARLPLAQRAAEELEAAADWMHSAAQRLYDLGSTNGQMAYCFARDYNRARAAALRGEGR